MTIFERTIKANFIFFYENPGMAGCELNVYIILNLALMPEYLTNFNSKMASIVLINASIY